MKKALLALGATLLLISCGPTQSPSLETLLENPLFAERYAEELVNVLTEMEIGQDPILQDETKAKQIAELKNIWLDASRVARQNQRDSLGGSLIPIDMYTRGEVLVKNRTVYLDTMFETVPGPNLHAYLTTAVDPRDIEFPDPSALDLGILPAPYGAQSLELPETEQEFVYRTFVLFDRTIGKIYGIAQLSGQ